MEGETEGERERVQTNRRENGKKEER